jgi:chemotaxis protein histidine kinase CheA
VADLFADRLAAVRQRFVAKLGARLDEIEGTVPQLSAAGSADALARAHRRAHDLCGVSPTMGFVATGKAARTVEKLLLAPLKADRALTEDEVIQLRQDLAELRSVATAETRPAEQEQ